jgi:glutathione synthase
MKKKPAWLWITDPWKTLDHSEDTTLRIAQAALRLGVRCYWCSNNDISVSQGSVRFRVQELLEIQDIPRFTVRRSGAQVVGGERFTQIHYRTDPPVDLAYLQPLQLISLDPEARKRVVNPIDVLLGLNEKNLDVRFDLPTPPTLVSAQIKELYAFTLAQGETVLKPFHQAQSKGVERLELKRPSATRKRQTLALLKRATQGETLPVIVQKFIPQITQGEQRLWFVDGELLDYARKLPARGQFKIDMDRGGSLVPTRLNARERKAVPKIQKALRALHIRLAAVDMIDGWVTDFNYTSPGLIRSMERVLGTNLATPMVQALLQKR